MRNYINTKPNAEELLVEFETAKAMFGGKYPLVKKWFLDTFKDDADTFKVSEAKKQIAMRTALDMALDELLKDWK